jgi:hypothetical protein
MERLRLERARFELDVADLVMKHLDKLKASGVFEVEDRTEAARTIAKAFPENTLENKWKRPRWRQALQNNLVTFAIHLIVSQCQRRERFLMRS